MAALLAATKAHSASIRGIVTDASGARVTGAAVALVQNGKVVTSAVSVGDGSYEILTGNSGRFFLLVSAPTFRQLETPSFYAGRLDSMERNMVLEPEWVRQSIVVTATGTPTPQPQTSAATSVVGPSELADAHDPGQRSAPHAGNLRGADWPAGIADVALYPRRRLR